MEQQFKTAKLRETPVKLINLFWGKYDCCYNDYCSFEKCNKINFRYDQVTFLAIDQALKFPDFLCNIEASLRWCGEEEMILTKKFKTKRRKRNALLTEDRVTQRCVIWEECIDDVNSFLDIEGKTLVRMTNVKQTCFKEIVKLETTTETLIKGI